MSDNDDRNAEIERLKEDPSYDPSDTLFKAKKVGLGLLDDLKGRIMSTSDAGLIPAGVAAGILQALLEAELLFRTDGETPESFLDNKDNQFCLEAVRETRAINKLMGW